MQQKLEKKKLCLVGIREEAQVFVCLGVQFSGFIHQNADPLQTKT